MTYLTVVNTLVYGVEYGRGSDWGEDEGVFWGGVGGGVGQWKKSSCDTNSNCCSPCIGQ